ncbi:MAG: glutaredoxin family protein [Candidatus Dormibacteraeota bacterium]|jgi:thiol-disulfide isomerase/thioredoxin|nr:glutaredoxin family protein [Candidatus Dormibacteraeota bacterium]
MSEVGQVILLTAEGCAFCEQAKTLLDELARDYRLVVTTMDIASPEGTRLALANRLLFPPGILLDGSLPSYGRLSAGRLRREFDRRLVAERPGPIGGPGAAGMSFGDRGSQGPQ